jgi:uncharacterized protein
MVNGAFGWILDRKRIAVATLIGISLAAGVGLTKLRFDDELDRVFRGASPEQELLDELADQIPFERSEFLVLVASQELISSQKIGALRDLQSDLIDLDQIEEVRSILQLRDKNSETIVPAPGLTSDAYRSARESLLANPRPGLSLTDEGDATLIRVEPARQLSAAEDFEPVYQQMERIAERVNATGLITVSVTGLPAMRCDLVRIQRSELPAFILVGTLIGLLAAWVMFRSGASILIAAPVPVLAAFWSLGMMGLFNRPFDLMAIVITPLAMTIAITDTIHLLCAIREGIEKGQSPLDASKNGLILVGPACLLASLTTMIAFASLALSQSPMLANLGLTCAGVTALVFVSTILWVPLASSTKLGNKLGRSPDRRSLKLAAGIARGISRRSAVIVGFSVGLLIVCLYLASGIKPDYRFSEFLPSKQKAAAALQRVDSLFGGSSRLYVMLEWPEQMNERSPEVLAVLKGVEHVLAGEPEIGAPFSMVSSGGGFPEISDGEAPGKFWATVPQNIRERFTNSDVRRTLLSAPIGDKGSKVLLPVFERIEVGLGRLRQEHPGFNIQLTGKTYVHALMSGNMIGDLSRGLLTASAGIFLIVGLALRSADLAVRSIVPNILPLAGVVALLVLLGGSLHYNGVLALTIGLGIAIDDSLHFLYRFKHEMRTNGGDRPAAIEAILHSVGSALVTTTVVLVSGLGVLLFCSLPMARHFAMLIMVVLVLALLSDLIILPALLCYPRKALKSNVRK